MRITRRMLLGDRAAQLSRLREKGWRVVTFKALPLVVAYHRYEKEGKTRCEAKAWRGNADVPAFYYTFRDEAQAKTYVADYANKVRQATEVRAAQTAERRSKRASLKASDHYTVGDVLYNSWGYDQTNIDYYEVIEVKARSIVIRELASTTKETGFMCGPTQPKRGEFTGEPMMKPLDEDGRISARFGCFSKWDGKPQQCSWYA